MTRCSPSGSTGLGRSVAWTSDGQGRWAANWVGWDGFNKFMSQLVSWTFPGEESGGMEAEFITEGDDTKLQLRSVESDGTPRNFFDTVAGVTDPNLTVNELRLDQVAPGIYETDLGSLTPGAYALRFVQTKPGETPLARTVMLIAPTPAEYRLLGTNQRLLAALRGATGGAALEDGAAAWDHNLGTTTAATDLLPWLLLLALLLWPLDVAVRRVSVSRGDLALARSWSGARWRQWRGPARRPEPVGEMLAATRRAGGAESRAALMRPSDGETSPQTETPQPTMPPKPTPTAPKETPAVEPAAPAPTPAPQASAAPNAAPTPTPGAARPSPPPAPTAPDQAAPDTLARLREAKQRARDQR